MMQEFEDRLPARKMARGERVLLVILVALTLFGALTFVQSLLP